MKITDGQMTLLSTLSCERLSISEDNLQRVGTFSNSRNYALTHKLLNEAYEEDEQGIAAYYLVKDSDGEILFYFSLKCGQMFDRIRLLEKDSYTRLMIISLHEKIDSGDLTDEQKKSFSERLDAIIKSSGLTPSELQEMLDSPHIVTFKKVENLAAEKKKVDNTFPCIELALFCKNEACKPKWTSEQIPQKLGTIVFWLFIVPIVLEAKALVGCQYLYLFAADLDPEETLVKYYMHYLDFELPKDRKTAIPTFDEGCKLLMQDTQNLRERMEYFFDNFNAES